VKAEQAVVKGTHEPLYAVLCRWILYAKRILMLCASADAEVALMERLTRWRYEGQPGGGGGGARVRISPGKLRPMRVLMIS